MKKLRLILVAVLLCLLFGVLSACNEAPAYDFIDGAFGYTFNDDGKTVTLSYWKDRSNGDIVIPVTATNGDKTYTVTVIGNGAFAAQTGKLTASDCFGNYTDVANNDLLSVTFEEGSQVTKIEGRAFEKCKKITSVVLPETVTEIEGFAFYKCTSLTTVTIGSKVKKLGDDCFNGCTALKEVYLNSTSVPEVGDRAFKWYDSSVTSFMGSADTYKVISGLKLIVTNDEILKAFTSTGTSTNLNLRYWHDYKSCFKTV